MAGLLKNKFVYTSDKLNFSRSTFRYEKRHSTNMLAGMIVPVHTEFCYPGTTPDLNFGCVIEAAPLISTCLDNIYVDVVSIWTPCRLVMEDWNEFLGESNSTAFTINRNVSIPKVATIYTDRSYAYGDAPPSARTVHTKAFLADNFLAPHLGYRLYGVMTNHTFTPNGGSAININAGSAFYNGVSVLPSRVYDLNWNTFFRNENVQQPILINKTSTFGGTDANYVEGLGSLKLANKLKSWFTDLTPAPSLLDVNLLEQFGGMAPVGTIPDYSGTSSAAHYVGWASGTTFTSGDFLQATDMSGGFGTDINIYANLSALTVNRMYYALMEQRFANKMMKGRRAVEFYENFFGVQDSKAHYDLPQLLIQKRYPLNISQVVATASGTNGTETTDLGQRGAISTTGFGDKLIKNFTTTEHGYIQTYLIIRGQQSISDGIDAQLGYENLLDTYLPEFDHIGPVGVEALNIGVPGSTLYVGYTNAWYPERNPVSDVVGIMSPGEPLAYKTLAPEITPSAVISDWWLKHWPGIIDRIFLFPVCYVSPAPGSGASIYGEPLTSNRYQFLVQFVVKGKEAKVMSPDSEPLKLRL